MLPWLGLGGVLGVAILLRFTALHRIGLHGDDTLYYLALVRDWAEAPRPAYRPVALVLYGLADALGGRTDWAVKALNAGVDVASVGLLFAIARALGGSRATALVAAGLYAVMPRAVAFARTELLHTLSTFALLGALALLLLHLQSAREGLRRAAAPLCGVLLGLGYGVHESMVAFAPGFALVFALAPGTLRARLVGVAAFSGGALLALTLLGFWQTLALVLGGGAEAAGSGAGRLLAASTRVSYAELYIAFAELNTSWLLSGLFGATALGAVALGVFSIWRPALAPAAGFWTPARFAPLILCASFLLFYPLLSRWVFPRLFLPASALVLLTLALALQWWAGLLFGRRAALAVVAGGLLLAVSLRAGVQDNATMQERMGADTVTKHRYYTPPTTPWLERDAGLLDVLRPDAYRVSSWRAVANALADGVGPERRLLVGPHALSPAPARRAFRHYFGPDAVYVHDCRTSMPEFIRGQRVRYVVLVASPQKVPRKAPECLGLAGRQYRVEDDFAFWQAFLNRPELATRYLETTPGYSIYELSGPAAAR